MRIGLVGRIAALAVLGAALGLGIYTFVYAKGCSYLTNDPQACANCHVMHEQYDGWLKSSHRAVAICNDCHTPHDFVGKYCDQGRTTASGTRSPSPPASFHEPIRISSASRQVTEARCRRCHGQSVAGHGHAGPRGLERDLLHPLPRLGRPHGAVGDDRPATGGEP